MKYYLGKCDYNGSGRKNCKTFVTWKLENGNFSMSGEIWNPRETDCYTCGQCVDTVRKFFPFDKKIRSMHAIWTRWHLNDLRAGCEHQRAEKWNERPIDPTKPTKAHGKHFPGQEHDSWNMLTWITPAEHPDGLLGAPCPVCGYKYGTAWLKEELPAEVVSEINSWSA